MSNFRHASASTRAANETGGRATRHQRGTGANRPVHRTTILATSLLAIAALVTVLPSTAPVGAATTLTVDSTDDRGDTSPGDGVCRTSRGTCTLRAAIEEANALAGPDTIRFAIAGNGPHTIDIDETLTIQDRSGGTTIDGYTQSGSSPNTHSRRSNAQIRVEITSDDVLWPMILVTSPGNTFRGLSIYGNGPRLEFRGEEADGNRVLGNFIGINADATETSGVPSGQGNALAAADAGVAFNLGPDRNAVGSPDAADRNVISGNNRYGIRLNHGETSQNIFENNIIGLGPDLSAVAPQAIGLDVQWWTWGNLITDNLISGHRSQGIDLSHSVVGNAVIGNRIGTTANGNAGNDDTSNRWGVTFKDNPLNNFVAENIIANNREEGIWHKHNYTGSNTVVDNRIGVGSNGASLGNGLQGMLLRGHDDLFQDNIVANNDGGIFITDTTQPPGPHTNFPPEATLGNILRQNTFYGNGNNPPIDIESEGSNQNDPGDGDDGAHNELNYPTVDSIGPGEVYGDVCSRCTVEVYISGVVSGNGTLDTGTSSRGGGAAWIGSVTASGSGQWSLAHPHIAAGKDLTAIAIDSSGNTSETAPSTRVPSSKQGNGTNAGQSQARVATPDVPARPPAWQPDVITCSWNAGVLSWSDEGASEYYLRTVDASGIETYVGARSGTSTAVPNAAGYRVVDWSKGFARSATCDGPGDGGGPGSFSCSVDGGTLSWTNQGAANYFVRLVNAAGADTYFGSSTGTSLAVPPASEYLVIHWTGGTRNATTCDGPGEQPAFTCSHAGGTLSWTDQSASTYYVRLVNAAGADTYFGSATGTSLSVPAAAQYMVIHWTGGTRNATTCSG